MWMNRDLVRSPIYYCLCLTEAQFHKELRKMKIPQNEWPSFVRSAHADATAHHFTRDGSDYAILVTLKEKEGLTLEQIYGLLIHESVHIWQAIRRHIGEDFPSAEFEAYSIHAISQNMMVSYAKHKNKKKAGKK